MGHRKPEIVFKALDSPAFDTAEANRLPDLKSGIAKIVQVPSNCLNRNRLVLVQFLSGVANSRNCELPQKSPLTYQRFGFAHRGCNCTWALEVGAWKADDTTTAVSHYLVEYQKDTNRWLSSSQRLPSMGSPFTATYVALRALSHYGTDGQDGGTWHVVTHAKPIQTYYESGFPHAADQFISITATAWATLALAGSLSEAKAVAKP